MKKTTHHNHVTREIRSDFSCPACVLQLYPYSYKAFKIETDGDEVFRHGDESFSELLELECSSYLSWYLNKKGLSND